MKHNLVDHIVMLCTHAQASIVLPHTLFYISLSLIEEKCILCWYAVAHEAHLGRAPQGEDCRNDLLRPQFHCQITMIMLWLCIFKACQKARDQSKSESVQIEIESVQIAMGVCRTTKM